MRMITLSLLIFLAKNRIHAKRCLLALADNMAKHLITLKDRSLQEVLEFLDSVEMHGKSLKAVSSTLGFGSQHKSENLGRATLHSRGTSSVWPNNTISYEARLLKCLFIKLME